MRTIHLLHREWGHDYTFTPIDGGQRGRMVVWIRSPVYPGDFLVLRNGETTTRYQVENVRRMADPPDQMFLDVRFAPRTEEEKR